MPTLVLVEPRVSGRFVDATISPDAPCGAELCWDGSFQEKIPVATQVRLQAPAVSRRCLGEPSLGVSADLQPMIDAYRAYYPRAAVEIDLGFATLHDAAGDDAICRALSVDSCEADPRCRPLAGAVNDAERMCTGPTVKLGCGAKTMGCGAALTGGQAPDGRRAVFPSTCIPEGWSSFYGGAPDYSWPVCAP